MTGCMGQGKQLKPSDIEAQISKSGLDIDQDSNNATDEAFGGTNANTFAQAKVNMGLVPGVDIATFTHDHSGIYEPADATILKDADIGSTVQGYSANLDAVTTPGVAGTFLKSYGTTVSWDVAGGAGGGTIGGTLGSVNNVVPRVEGTGGLTLKNSLATLSDAGSFNIPTGQTYNINGSAHTHNYQTASSNLTSFATVTPSANALSMLSLTYANMLTALGGQPVDTDLTALAGITRAQGSLIIGGASAWEGLAIGAVGKVLKSTGTTIAWLDDENDGGAGISTWDEIGDSTADATIDLVGYKTIFTSELDTGTIWTFTNTDASLSAATSFMDFKATADGDSNLYFMRGYDNAGNDLKWSIGPNGSFFGYTFETAQAATGGVLDLLEGSGGGTTAYLRIKAPDDITTSSTNTFTFSSSVTDSEDLTITLGNDDNTATVGSTTGVTEFNFGAINLVTSGTIQGKLNIITDDITLAASQVYGSVIVMSGGAETATLPAAVVGMNVLFYASGAGVKNIDPNGTDTIVLTTAALAAGYQIKSPGAVGDFIALVCLSANQWTAMGRSGVWVTNGS